MRLTDDEIKVTYRALWEELNIEDTVLEEDEDALNVMRKMLDAQIAKLQSYYASSEKVREEVKRIIKESLNKQFAKGPTEDGTYIYYSESIANQILSLLGGWYEEQKE